MEASAFDIALELHLVLEPDSDAGPIRGRLYSPQHGEQPFSGWLGLLESLNTLSEKARAASAGRPDGGT